MNTPGKTIVGRLEDSIIASDLTDELNVLAIELGSPRVLRIEKGPEFISKDLRGWTRDVDLVSIPPG